MVGVGAASAATPDEVADLVAATLQVGGVPPSRVRAIATVESRRDHPAITALGWPVVAYPAARLGSRVAEPAALLAAGDGAVLVVGKRRSARATAAVARSPAARRML